LYNTTIMEQDKNRIIEEVTNSEYKWGFVTNVENDAAPKGLTEDTIRFISAKKGEPEFLLEFRLKAYRHWLTMKEPTWAHIHYPPIDYQELFFILRQNPRQKKKILMMLIPNY
jgi:Fe-S cluster assembly protein SufB